MSVRVNVKYSFLLFPAQSLVKINIMCAPSVVVFRLSLWPCGGRALGLVGRLGLGARGHNVVVA